MRTVVELYTKTILNILKNILNPLNINVAFKSYYPIGVVVVVNILTTANIIFLYYY